MWEVGAARLAESAAVAASWKLLNGNLSGNFTRRLSHGDTGALRKTKRRVSKSGSAQLTDGEDAEVGSGEQIFTCFRRSAPTNMPAIKKERLDGDEMALTAFNQSEYLAPLNATAIPVVTPHPPPYDHIFAHHRAYLGLHDSALHHQHLHHHTDDLMLERFSSIPDFQPFFDNGEPCIEVECGENKALLYINKLCQGSKGPSIKYRGEWLTPNEFQFVSGRETAKDWKRSIRHKGKSLKTLMSKGILQVHPPICDCPGCRISSPVNLTVFAYGSSQISDGTGGGREEITLLSSGSERPSRYLSTKLPCGGLGGPIQTHRGREKGSWKERKKQEGKGRARDALARLTAPSLTSQRRPSSSAIPAPPPLRRLSPYVHPSPHCSPIPPLLPCAASLGCNCPLGSARSGALPLSAPTLAARGVLCFVFCFGEPSPVLRKCCRKQWELTPSSASVPLKKELGLSGSREEGGGAVSLETPEGLHLFASWLESPKSLLLPPPATHAAAHPRMERGKERNRGRLAEKRTIPLPPNRVPKKELASIFSSDDSEGSERASGDHAHIKQEDELHYSIMRKRFWLNAEGCNICSNDTSNATDSPEPQLRSVLGIRLSPALSPSAGLVEWDNGMSNHGNVISIDRSFVTEEVTQYTCKHQMLHSACDLSLSLALCLSSSTFTSLLSVCQHFPSGGVRHGVRVPGLPASASSRCDLQPCHLSSACQCHSRPPSFPANPGLRSSLGSADSGDWVLNTHPSLFIFCGLSMTFPPPRERLGEGVEGGQSRDSDLSTIISNLHHTRQHGMPEGQSASDHNTSTGHTDDLLGKRRSFSPNSSSECPSDKKSRSVSPKENSQSPVVEAGGSHGHMSPEEHYRRMMSALSEQGSYEDQQQRLYQLASSMGLPGHDLLRARQEALAAAVRNPAALEAHLPSAGSSSSSSQRRKQGLPQHRDAHYTDSAGPCASQTKPGAAGVGG
ncbi:hypothetical protein FQN60_002116 [Etheostoma spectabile]|uniref:SAND domain-containing protein n=1 Tax=Etheostoma spectabile TaxID=54343 RepID=A0A5J5DCP6_9PERO|nr:hypothetical protein FQN60_002116 [Etheostoma spectabile]